MIVTGDMLPSNCSTLLRQHVYGGVSHVTVTVTLHTVYNYIRGRMVVVPQTAKALQGDEPYSLVGLRKLTSGKDKANPFDFSLHLQVPVGSGCATK
jgi:hypothetical protein